MKCDAEQEELTEEQREQLAKQDTRLVPEFRLGVDRVNFKHSILFQGQQAGG